ncbi:DUF3592 domain-containing protein [Pseudomonas sp. NPDC090202]|uniref:DUF3592 domain-containing protein n=1 Tax=Pseudomonas sp. NPDC090202 TaxID=3364476 RepID=UPI0037F5B7E8
MSSAIKYGFSIVGLITLVSGVVAYQKSSRFVEEAFSVQGKVVDYQTSVGEGVTHYKAVVEFVGDDGEKHRLLSTIASNPPAYDEGEMVEVLHPRGHPQDAKINGFLEVWGVATAMFGLGVPFFAVGVIMFLASGYQLRRNKNLKTSGALVSAQFQSVRCNYSLSFNGRNPFVIVCHWLNPETQKLHVFESENIWFNPERLIAGKAIDVYIRHGHPEKYYVDISFLPQVAA